MRWVGVMTASIHATAVWLPACPAGPLGAARSARGVLLFGPPGAGKSDLALRLLDRGATLISDDRVLLGAAGHEPDGRAYIDLTAPPTIAGNLEVRGIGILTVPHRSPARAHIAIELTHRPTDRLPSPATRQVGMALLPCWALNPFAAAAAVQVEIVGGG